MTPDTPARSPLPPDPPPKPPPEPQRRLRLRSPVQLLTMVPFRLGFEPTDSLVLLAVRGPRGEIGLVLRIDLPPRSAARAEARHLTDMLRRNGVTQVLLVVYGGGDEARQPDGQQPFRWLIDDVTSACGAAGIEVTDSFRVAAGRFWSYPCALACCPPEGTLLPSRDEAGAHQAVVTALTAEGMTVMGSREDRERLVAPVEGAARERMVAALARAAAEPVRDRDAAVDRTLELARSAWRAYADGRTVVDDATAAQIIVGMEDVEVRDAVGAWVECGDEEALHRLLVDLVRRAVPPHGAAVATALGFVCYARGDGMLASAAFDRALALDPGYRLAVYLSHGLRHGVPASAVREIGRRVLSDLEGRRRARQRAARPRPGSRRKAG